VGRQVSTARLGLAERGLVEEIHQRAQHRHADLGREREARERCKRTRTDINTHIGAHRVKAMGGCEDCGMWGVAVLSTCVHSPASSSGCSRRPRSSPSPAAHDNTQGTHKRARTKGICQSERLQRERSRNRRARHLFLKAVVRVDR
jgi:hypothetical protein